VPLTTSIFLELSILLHPKSNQPPSIMVSMTRAESKEAFNHVLDTVLDRGDSSSLKRSLIEDGITDIFDLITIADDVIDSLAYEDPNDRIFYPVEKGDKMLLRCFLAYQQFLEPDSGNVD
jgi:hypothetical protein